MTQYFVKSHFESAIHEFDFPPSLSTTAETTTTPARSPTESSPSWPECTVSETARRTIFLANIVNFLSNHDVETGLQSPYYEPLGDEMMLAMRLPCADATWQAGTEEQWMESLSGEVGTSAGSLGELLSGCTKEEIRRQYEGSMGFGSSLALKSFIVVCGLEQFGR